MIQFIYQKLLTHNYFSYKITLNDIKYQIRQGVNCNEQNKITYSMQRKNVGSAEQGINETREEKYKVYKDEERT